MLYRDLKPENILIGSDGHIKLADFGLSKELEADLFEAEDRRKTRTFSVCGTEQYMPPEIVNEKGHNEMADWWSLGITLFELATGQPPFSAGDGSEQEIK